MNIFTIPLKNIRRKPGKSLLLVGVFALGIMSIVALYQVSQIVGESLERKLTAFGANIVVAPARESLSVSYGGFSMGDMLFDVQSLQEKETESAIRSIGLKDRISVVSPKLVTMTRLDTTSVAVVGVRWREERSIKSYWAVDGSYPTQADQVVLGSQVAEKLHLQTNSVIDLFGQPFTVAGTLYETGGDDDTVILMDLGRLQTLLDRPGDTSFIEVAALCSGCPIDDIVAQLQTQLPNADIKALQSIVNQRMTSVHFVQKLALSMSIIILLTAAAMVGLSMLAAVNERKKDIGILRSLGYSKPAIFSIFCFEAAIIGAAAGFIGYLCGFFSSFKVMDLLNLAVETMPAFAPLHLLATCILFSLVTILAAAYPAWKGACIEPSNALVAL